MLAEIAVYLATPCRRDHRRLGYLKTAVDLWSRANRVHRAWAPHYAHCHAVVERAIAGLASRRTVLVLGSGLARDVPLARLATAFDRVVLADVAHLLPVRLRGLAHRNLRFVEIDLSGAADLVGSGTGPLTDALAGLGADPTLDLAISANLLSQLPLGVADALERGGRPVDPALPRRIVENHLDSLARLSCRVCLLTDTEWRRIDRSGRTVERSDLLHGATPPDLPFRWDWPVAPLGEDGPDHALVHAAGGHPDLFGGREPAGRHDPTIIV